MKQLSLIAIASGVLLSSGVSAQTQSGSGWGIGIGAVVQEQGYKGADTEAQLFPIVFYQGERFYWRGPELGYQIADNLNLFAEYRFDGFEREDSDFFTGMEERKGSLDVGAAYTFNTDVGDLTFSAQADVLSEHEGYELSVNYSKGFSALRGRITPFVEVSYMSDNLVDYYYGVRATEATALRPVYEGDNTVNASFGLSGFWSIAERQNIIASLSYSILGDEIENSPIMEDGESSSLFVGYIYQF